MGEGARLGDAGTAKAFLLAGNATLTLVSQKTGARFTYRVRQPNDARGPVHFVSLLIGTNNEADYAFIGTIFAGARFVLKGASEAPSAKAFAWAFARIERGEMPELLEVWHEGKCGKCGRKLTVPSSIASGIGPVCDSLGG